MNPVERVENMLTMSALRRQNTTHRLPMPLHPDRLRDIIRLSIRSINQWSTEAEEILLMIAAHESGLGRYLHQIGGPALGLYGMEPATESDIWASYMDYRPGLADKIAALCGLCGPSREQLQYNPLYATVMARLKLRQCPGKLPPAYDINAMADYAKQYYNTPLGRATAEKYSLDYCRLVARA